MDHSLFTLSLIPFQDGDFWVHLFLGNEELEYSPVRVRIIKSEEQRRMEAMEKME